jgi:hypothetical protein
MKWFNYEQPWYGEKMTKFKDGLLHQAKALLLYGWVTTALIYISTMSIYKAVRELSKEIKKK